MTDTAHQIQPVSQSGNVYYLHAVIPSHAEGWCGPGLRSGSEMEGFAAGGFTVLMSGLSGRDTEETQNFAPAHQDILDRLRRSIPDMLPLPAGIVYPDLSVLRDRLRAAESHLNAAIAHIGAASEWRIDVYAPEGLPEDIPAELQGLHAMHDEALNETFEWFHTELSRYARDCLRIQGENPNTHDETGQFRSVYLVEDCEAAHFQDEIIRIREGLAHYNWRLDVRGPSPAASFIDLKF